MMTVRALRQPFHVTVIASDDYALGAGDENRLVVDVPPF